jgi:DNA polymerase-3 subunit epsilon
MTETARQLIVVDTETTGLGPDAMPLEIAAVNVDTGKELYFVPAGALEAARKADPEALSVNRFFERRVDKREMRLAETNHNYIALWDMLRGNTLAGSNPAFDAAVLVRGYKHCRAMQVDPETPWHHRLADLAAYSAPALGRAPSDTPGLNVVLDALGIENTCPHSALGDALATAAAFRLLREMYAHTSFDAMLGGAW